MGRAADDRFRNCCDGSRGLGVVRVFIGLSRGSNVGNLALNVLHEIE